MWYRFEDGSDIGIPRIKYYQINFYDMNHEGACFEEDLRDPQEIDTVMPFVETEEDKCNSIRIRVFAHFDHDDMYELKLVKIDKTKNNSFFFGKDTTKKRKRDMFYKIRWLQNRKNEEILNKLGISLYDEYKNFRCTYDVLNDLSRVWRDLDDEQRKYYSEIFAK